MGRCSGVCGKISENKGMGLNNQLLHALLGEVAPLKTRRNLN